MADLSAEGLAELLDGERGEDFTQRPYWQAFQPEVGPLARFADHPVVAALTRAQGPALLARWAARLVALRTLPRRMEALAGLLEDGTPDPPAVPGLGRAEVARGPLWHWAAAEGGEHAVRYRILAPTEWNFHPDGPVAHALMGLEAFKRGEGLERAEVLVASFDPCVAFAVGWAGGE
jgi:Ni,Fe-hydrogenase I large subunit